MKLTDLFTSAKTKPQYMIKRDINELVRRNSKFKNLDSKNRKLIMQLISKHLPNIRAGRGISSTVIQRETYRLNKDMDKLDLTLNDLKDIKEILNLFKK